MNWTVPDQNRDENLNHIIENITLNTLDQAGTITLLYKQELECLLKSTLLDLSNHFLKIKEERVSDTIHFQLAMSKARSGADGRYQNYNSWIQALTTALLPDHIIDGIQMVEERLSNYGFPEEVHVNRADLARLVGMGITRFMEFIATGEVEEPNCL